MASRLSTPIKWAIGSWSFFIAENVILSENRTFIIHDILKGNDDYYHYIYGLCSTTAVGSITYAYFNQIKPFKLDKKNADLLLWGEKLRFGIGNGNGIGGIPIKSRLLGFVTLSFGLGLISQTLPKLQIPVEYIASTASTNNSNKDDGLAVSAKVATTNGTNVTNDTNDSGSKWKVRCPFDFTDSKSKENNINNNNNKTLTIHDIHGMDRITRHPGLWSMGLIGLGASFLSPCIPTRIYLNMPLVMSLIGGEHNDSRFRRNIGGYLSEDFDRLTSNVPFWALISGRQSAGAGVTTGASAGMDENNGSSTSRLVLLSDFYKEEVKGLNLVLSMGLAAMVVARKGRMSSTTTSTSTSAIRSRRFAASR